MIRVIRVGLVVLALPVSGCNNKVHLFAKHASNGEAALFVARQPPMYEQMQPAQLRFQLPAAGRLVITFSTMGVVQPVPPAADMPPIVMQCRLDAKPCVATEDSAVQFKFQPEHPQGIWAYDTRAYTWVVANAAKGGHVVEMWGMAGFPNLVKLYTLTNWSLSVEAFDH